MLVPGRGTYTWGVTTPPADIPRAPPVRLELALLTVDETPPGLEWPLEVIDETDYQAGIWQKALSSSYPSVVYLDAAPPVATLAVWPVPDHALHAAALPLEATRRTRIGTTRSPGRTGYHSAMTYGLAVDLAPQYGVEASPTVQRVADEARRALFPINAEVGRLSLRPGRPVGGTALGYPRGFSEGWG